MANLPLDNVPRVTAAGAPANDYQRIDSSPADFGALQGQAEQKTGSQVAQAGDELATVALQRQAQFNQIASDDAFNKFQTRANTLTYGDGTPQNPGILNQRGSDALNAAPAARAALDQARQEIYNGMQNPAQQLQFDQASRRFQMFTSGEIDRHLDQQQDAYGLAVNKAGLENSAAQAGLNWNSDDGLLHAQATARANAVRSAQITNGQNLTPDLTQAAIRTADDSTISSAVLSASTVNPARAQAILTAHMSELSPQVGYQLTEHLKVANAKNIGISAAQGAIYGGDTPTGGTPAGLDAGTRSRAQMVHDAAVRQGAPDDEAWGIAANAVHESGATTAPTPGDGGISHGMFQLNRSQLAQYQAQHGGQMPEQGTIDQQVAFARQQAAPFIAGAKGPDGYAAAYSQGFERPAGGTGEAANRAQTALALAGGGGGAAQVPPSQMVAVGDSIAVLAQRRNGYGGGGVVGAQPEGVLDQVNAIPLGSLVGKPVVLSTGASNNPAQIDKVVPEQIASLKARGATDIRIVGVGDAKFPGVNAKLASIAQQNGVTFTGPLTNLQPDGVHPANATGLGMTATPAVAQGGPTLANGVSLASIQQSVPSVPQGNTGLPIDYETAVGNLASRTAGNPAAFSAGMTYLNTVYAAAKKSAAEGAERAGNGLITQIITNPSKIDPVKDIANNPAFNSTEKEHYNEIYQKAITAAATGGHDDKTYGKSFWKLNDAVLDGQLTDPHVLSAIAAGQDGQLTVAGYDKLSAAIQSKKTPEGEAEAQQQSLFWKWITPQIKGTAKNLYGQDMPDPKGDEIMLKVAPAYYQAVQKGKAQGLSIEQMLNPQDPHFIGTSLVSNFARKPADLITDQNAAYKIQQDQALGAAGASVSEPPPDLTTRDGVVAALNARKITYAAARQALAAMGVRSAAPSIAAPLMPNN